jgi:hypothetical protein
MIQGSVRKIIGIALALGLAVPGAALARGPLAYIANYDSGARTPT